MPVTNAKNNHADLNALTEREVIILKLLAEEKTLKEIGDVVNLSPRTVEAIKYKMFEKAGSISMAGLILYGVRNGLLDEELEAVQLIRKN